MIYTISLLVLIIAQGLQSFFERRRRDILIDRLTDKIMSRDYRDYVWGQDMKKDTPPVEFRSRTDEAEARIDEQHKKAEALTEHLGKVEKQMNKKIMGM